MMSVSLLFCQLVCYSGNMNLNTKQ